MSDGFWRSLLSTVGIVFATFVIVALAYAGFTFNQEAIRDYADRKGAEMAPTDADGHRVGARINNTLPVRLFTFGGPPSTGLVFKHDGDGSELGRVCFVEADGAWKMLVNNDCRP